MSLRSLLSSLKLSSCSLISPTPEESAGRNEAVAARRLTHLISVVQHGMRTTLLRSPGANGGSRGSDCKKLPKLGVEAPGTSLAGASNEKSQPKKQHKHVHNGKCHVSQASISQRRARHCGAASPVIDSCVATASAKLLCNRCRNANTSCIGINRTRQPNRFSEERFPVRCPIR